MTYVKAEGETVLQFPFTLGQLKSENANTSFPRKLSAEVLAQFNVFSVTTAPAPDIDDRTQKRGYAEAPTRSADGAWVLGWVVTDKSSEEIEAYDDAKRQGVRSQRDILLSQTDWMALSDVTMEPYWLEYRQQLRDVTAQEGFPYAVIWPTQPE